MVVFPIIYEHYPISERETDENKSKGTLLRAAERIHELVNSNKNNKIYVHCSLGMNRSPAAVLMYYIKYRGMSLYEAYKTIILKRRIFTSAELFDILYKESIQNNKNTTSDETSIFDMFSLKKHLSCNVISPLN